VKQIKSLDDLVGEISAASKEQSQGTNEVNMAVSQMDKVTQSNAAHAEQNASAAEELNAQVGSLQEIVGQLQTVVRGSAAKETVVSKEAVVPLKTAKAAKRKAAPSFKHSVTSSRGVSADGDIPMPEPANLAASFKDF